MKNNIQVGIIVIAKRAFLGGCQVGTYGVCYEQYQIGKEPGWSFLFENGDYDGFSANDADVCLHLPGVYCEALANYEFTSVMRLSKDYQRGVFEPAFEMARNLDPSLIFPAHRGRVS